MGVEHVTAHARDAPMREARPIGPRRVRAARLTVLLGGLPVSAIPQASVAHAHVKWFVPCNVAEAPIPLADVLTPAFWLFSALFVTLLSLCCVIERTASGTILAQYLDRWSEPLRQRQDEFLRAAAAIAFALLWADGGLILTPELKVTGVWLSAIQALIPIYLFARATLPAAGAGIVVLYGYGVGGASASCVSPGETHGP